jgi:hypothetical protein
MADDFSKYQAMRDAGSSPEDAFREAASDRVDAITRIRMLRAVFSLSPREAKEVSLRAEGIAESLDRHEEMIAEELARAARAESVS